MKHLLVAILFYTLCTTFAYAEPTQWENKVDKDGITVFVRHHPETSQIEAKATVNIAANKVTLMTFIQQIDQWKNWMNGLKDSKAINADTAKPQAYLIYDLPWPMSDRDSPLSMASQEVSATVSEIHLATIKDYPDHGLPRMENVKMKWLIEQSSPSALQVTYSFLGKKPSIIPDWYIEKRFAEGPYKTLNALREIMQEK